MFTSLTLCRLRKKQIMNVDKISVIVWIYINIIFVI